MHIYVTLYILSNSMAHVQASVVSTYSKDHGKTADATAVAAVLTAKAS